jgi:hypothetical protein
MHTLTITYQGTLEDLFAVPLPHLVTIDEAGRTIGLIGGEISGLNALIGFTTTQGPIDFRSSAFRGLSAWMERLDELRGWFPVYTDNRGWPSAYPYRIERIEVSQ